MGQRICAAGHWVVTGASELPCGGVKDLALGPQCVGIHGEPGGRWYGTIEALRSVLPTTPGRHFVGLTDPEGLPLTSEERDFFTGGLPDVSIALPGGYGTWLEVVWAVYQQRPVVFLGPRPKWDWPLDGLAEAARWFAPGVEVASLPRPGRFLDAASPEEAVRLALGAVL